MMDETSISATLVAEDQAGTQVRKFLLRKRMQATLAGIIGPHPTRHQIVSNPSPAPRPMATADLQEPDVVDLIEAEMERVRESMRGGER